MCCFSQKTIKCCSKCLCFTSLILFLCMSAIALLGVQVSRHQLLERITVDDESIDKVEAVDLSRGSNLVISCVLILICLLCLSVLCTWLTKLTMNKSVCCTWLTAVILFLFFVGFMLAGSVLIIPGTLGDNFIQEHCKLVEEQKIDEMSVFYREIFREIETIDKKIDEAVNEVMCYDRCKCLNDENQTIRKIYLEQDEETFRKYGRTKSLTDNPEGYGLKALKFQADAKDEGYETLLDCYRDVEQRMEDHKDDIEGKDYQDYNRMNNSKLEPNQAKIISYLEETYECSGICRTPFFYFSLPPTKGVPKKPCLDPLNKEIGEEALYLGITLQATSLIFLFMLICTCPLFCFDNELAVKEAAAENDINIARRAQQDGYDFSDFANANPRPANRMMY